FSILGPQALNFKMTGEAPERTGSSSNTAAPRGVYQSKDGKWISMSASMQVMAERVLRAMGREDLITDPKFVTNGLRVKNNKELDPLVRAWMAERTLEENMAIFKRENITAAPVLDISQIVEDEHFREREILVEVPDEDLGSIPMHNIIPRLSDSPGHLRRPAPTLGQHTEEILGDLGLSADDLIRLSKDGVI
ncbi:MAG: CoA transferase, partial [Rhodospirillales bacterium]|nr:CoA transferase [Rhodospirillales bacterium]